MRISQTQNKILSVLLSLALIFTPARQAQAFAPAIYGVYAASSAMGLGGGAVIGTNILSTTLAIGAGFGLLLLSTSAGDQVRLPLTSSSANAPAAPYAPPTTSPTSSGTGARCEVHPSYGGGLSIQTACEYILNQQTSSHPNGWWLGTITSTGDPIPATCVEQQSIGTCTYEIHQIIAPFTSIPNNYYTIVSTIGTWPIQSCSSGYVMNNGVCELTDARLASPDQACDYARSGSALAMISDPDCAASGTALQVMCSAGGMSCSGVGVTASGQPQSFVVTPTPNGGSTVTVLQQSTVGGQTVVTTTTTTVGGDSTVTGVSSSTSTGSIDTTTGTVTTGTIVPPTEPAPTIVFPTDYNREATQIQIKDALSIQGMPGDVPPGDVTTLSDALTGRNDFINDIGAIPSASDPVSPVGFAAAFQPFVPSACVPLSYTFGSSMTAGNHTVNLNLCPYVSTIQRIGAWALYLLTAGMLFQMFTRRPEGV